MNHPYPSFQFDNTYARDLEGFYVDWKADKALFPRLLQLNHDLARDLNLDPDALENEAGTAILAGVHVPDGAHPLAQVYAGHQFGSFSPQLGDGRALLLGEVIDRNGVRRDIQLKGSGRTPFSRGGDGKAAIGPVLREYIIGEAMHALGIPTTRALAAVATGEEVYREKPLPGAVLTRVASSHIRVGTFQFFAARGETEQVRKLAEYAIDRHYPDLRDAQNPFLALLAAVADAQAALIARWMQVGFIHGVMNTDNVAISGETLDYGPCAFMDAYAPDTVFSSIDEQGRYAYGSQPIIGQWNLARLAETLLELIDPEPDTAKQAAIEVINAFPGHYTRHWLNGMRTKIGLITSEDGDLDLVNGLFTAIEGQDADFTLLFRRLSLALLGDDGPVRDLLRDPGPFVDWLAKWQIRLGSEGVAPSARAQAMDRVNPLYIARNHKVEEALAQAEAGSMEAIDRLLTVVRRPYEERPGLDDYANPAPAEAEPYRTFCGT